MVTKALVLSRGDGWPWRRDSESATKRRRGPASPELLPIANRPVLLHTLDALEGSGLRAVTVVVDPGLEASARQAVAADHGRDFELNFLVSRDGDCLGSLLADSEELLEGQPFLLHLGDMLCRAPLSEAVLQGVPDGEHDALLFVEERTRPARPEVYDLTAGRIGEISNGRFATPPLAGVCVLGPGAAHAGRELGPLGDVDLELAALVERLYSFGGRVETRPIPDSRRIRSQPEAILAANRHALEGLRPDYEESSLVDSHIQGQVRVDPSARLRSTTVRGPVVIGAGARIESAYIGPYTSIGEDVLIEGAELEHSIVLKGATISHIGGRIEASLVGPGAKVFRDFSLPRALRLRVGEGAEVSLF